MEKGQTFRYKDRKYHLVQTIEDNGKTFYIVKFYGKYKQWWHYEVWSDFELELILKKK